MAITRCIRRRQVVQQERHALLDVGSVDHVVVVEHEHDIVRHRAELVEQAGEDRSRSAAAGATRRSESEPAPTSGATVCSAAIT